MVIGLFGYKGVGKDTTADLFVKNFNFCKYSFALPIKQCLSHMFGWSMDKFEYPYKEQVDPSYGISPRQAMVTLGTDFAQHMLCDKFPLFKEITGKSIWVQRFFEFCEKHKKEDIIIADVRFPHEVEALNKINGIFIKVNNIKVVPDVTHESEQYINEINENFVIDNNTTIDKLEESVIYIYSKIIGGK